MVQDWISDPFAQQGQGWMQNHLWIFCEVTAQMPAFTNQHWPAVKAMTSYILSITLFCLKRKVLMNSHQFTSLEKQQQKKTIHGLMCFLNVLYLIPSCKSVSDECRCSTNRIIKRNLQDTLIKFQRFMPLTPFCARSIFV